MEFLSKRDNSILYFAFHITSFTYLDQWHFTVHLKLTNGFPLRFVGFVFLPLLLAKTLEAA